MPYHRFSISIAFISTPIHLSKLLSFSIPNPLILRIPVHSFHPRSLLQILHDLFRNRRNARPIPEARGDVRNSLQVNIHSSRAH